MLRYILNNGEKAGKVHEPNGPVDLFWEESYQSCLKEFSPFEKIICALKQQIFIAKDIYDISKIFYGNVEKPKYSNNVFFFLVQKPAT